MLITLDFPCSCRVFTYIQKGQWKLYPVLVYTCRSFFFQLYPRLKHIPKPNMKVCVLGDQMHIDESEENNLPCMSADELKKLNKDKKLVKKLGKSVPWILVVLPDFDQIYGVIFIGSYLDFVFFFMTK